MVDTVNTAFANDVENDSVNDNDVRVEKPVVLLPFNGVSYTESAQQLAGAYEREPDLYKKLFCKGGKVCTVVKNIFDGDISLEVLTPSKACTKFEQIATLAKTVKQKESDDGNEKGYIQAVCTDTIANKILQSEVFLNSLLPVNHVTNASVIVESENGLCEIINQYDRRTGFFVKGVSVPNMYLEESKERIKRIVNGYQFKTPSDRSRAIAALITPALIFGGLLKTRAPMTTIEADKSQSGKGFLNKIICALYGEKFSPVTQRGRGVGGMDEKFDDALCKGHPFIVLDNLRGRIESQQIESFLTEPFYQARIPHLGYQNIDPTRYIVLATSNNFDMSIDLANRASIIRIQKRKDDYQFQKFPEGNILDHIKANQPLYLAAVFAVIKEWVRQGKPVNNDTRHDFREWATTLDWIVQNLLECAPLLDGHREMQECIANPEVNWLQQLGSVVNSAGDLGKELTAHQLAELAEMGDVERPGAMGMSLEDHDEKGKRQVCSQMAKRISKIFRLGGCEQELSIGNMRVTRQLRKITYASGKSEDATMYRFDLEQTA